MPEALLPVIWWVFWLVVVALGGGGIFAWWLFRAAVREDEHAEHADRERQAP